MARDKAKQAEWARNNRKKKKLANDDTYKAKEKQRNLQKKLKYDYLKPVNTLTEQELADRRAQVRERVKKSRSRKKLLQVWRKCSGF